MYSSLQDDMFYSFFTKQTQELKRYERTHFTKLAQSYVKLIFSKNLKMLSKLPKVKREYKGRMHIMFH